ncbi:MAG TPA: DVUA0089 family protein [Fimbriimonadaceae bacterium]|nr:DVUA0089 family protein [Fimbriimonadaceae bacterium]
MLNRSWTVFRRLAHAALATSALSLSVPALAVDYNENEPNNSFPPNFLPGNPLFMSGDRLLGQITANDNDDHYLTVQGGGVGIFRYTFDLNTGGGDSILEIYDHTASGHFLGRNDDRTFTDRSSLVVFDHFATSASNPVFGVGIYGFLATDTFTYALTITRTTTPVTNLGSLGNGVTTHSGAMTSLRASWHQFTLGGLSDLVVDTSGSNESDTELVIFNSAGQIVGANDDENAGGGVYTSRVALSNLAAGTYYAVVGAYPSFYDYDTFTNQPIGWDRSGFSGGRNVANGGYNLRFNVTPVPEPATLAAMGLGLAGVLIRRRRK